MSYGTGTTSAPQQRAHALIPHQGGRLSEAEAARSRATVRLRDAEHWRRLVEARLDLAVAAVADIDDLEATLTELRGLVGIPSSDGDERLAESSLLIRLRSALHELDRYIGTVRGDVDDADARVAASIVADCPPGSHAR